MEEPPLKRAKRATDDDLSRNSSKNGRDHAKSKSRLDDGGDRDEGGGRQRPKIQQKDGRRNDRSRSRDDTYNDNKRHRERSRSRERSHRDRVERGGGAAARERHVNGGDSLERHNKSSQDSKSYQRPRKHSRSRSRSPVRDGGAANGSTIRTRSPPPPRRSENDHRGRNREATTKTGGDTRSTHGAARSGQPAVVNGDRMAVDEADEDALLRNMMGFTTFKSTQNTKVPGNQIYGVRKEKKTEYRQYMNRVGGFNRPLSPSR
ncbi:hypothetical protein H2204_004293 [Knufia peltigerae]|uniref:U4/U6.U5 small nuclear ribonucleoprotein 27kDa protein domain-containing protein n=1 Tax=Knufia peltigerae TaxID=1002370 RepID=A0AA39CZV3_9EURO|nr:hypothetical protein H2204_004293 [Knufia peltigerae]